MERKVENGRLPPPTAETVAATCRVLGLAPEDVLTPMGKIPSAIPRTVRSNTVAQPLLRQA